MPPTTHPAPLPARIRQLARTLRKDETGGTGVFLVGGTIALLTIGFVAVLVLGDAVADRRQANTASDSAALAGASYCADQLVTAYEDAVKSTDAHDFWKPFGKPVSTYCHGTAAQAHHYASENNATLTSFRPRYTQLKFDASVREDSGVKDTTAHQTSSATARIVTRRGLCVSDGNLGIQAEGRCQTQPTRLDPQTSQPQRPTGYSSTAEARTRLTEK